MIVAMTELERVADELYGETPAEFTMARNGRSAAARKDGDRELAEQIRKLAKPSPAAWLVNLLARNDADGVEELASLGASLREAQERLDRTALTALGRTRRGLIATLAARAGELAGALGHPPTAAVRGEVEQTLLAATADADAADAIRSGRLLRSLATVGFDPVDLTDAVAAPGAPRPSAKAPGIPDSSAAEEDGDARRELADAKQEAKDAERLVAGATAELAEVDARVSAAHQERARLSAELSDLEERLRVIEDELADADREERSLGRERDRAARVLATAVRDAEQAITRVNRLGQTMA